MSCPYLHADAQTAEEEYNALYGNKKQIISRRTKFSNVPINGNDLSTDDDFQEEEKEKTKQKQDKKYSNCYYHEYLQLDKILNANDARSGEFLDEPSHDEHLFITIHQAYELWFKQILFELNSCINALGSDILQDREILKVVSRLQRINSILKLLVEQFTILDTMTPLDFLDFRKYLKPASGFQSVQFRILENRLGLDRAKRIRYNKQEYTEVLKEKHVKHIKQSCPKKKTLFDVIQKWLERFPYLQSHDWSFWKEYKSAVNDYILEEKQLYLSATCNVDDKLSKERMIKELNESYQSNVATFNCIFDENIYKGLQEENKVRLSYTSLQAALMIMLYRDEPILQMPFRVIELSMEMDSLLTQWRNAHALMVHRMLGSKMGTGGSSGFHYLRTAAVHHKVFSDFFNLSTYMIPKSNLPKLPNSLRFFMNFPSLSYQKNRRIPIFDQKKLYGDKYDNNPILGNRGNNKSQTTTTKKITRDLPPFSILTKALSMSPRLFASTIIKSPKKMTINSDDNDSQITSPPRIIESESENDKDSDDTL